VQVNGKVRARINVPADLTRENANEYLAQDPEFQKLTEGKTVKKCVYVPGRLVNVVL